jgi:hypothetical protein
MPQFKTVAAAITALTFVALPVLAADPAHDQHHPAPAASAATAPATPAAPAPGTSASGPGMAMPGGGMMGTGGMMGGGMMGGNMPMMMGMMRGGMMSGGMGRMDGMGMMSSRAGHVEGRIAFLKAELKITDAHLPQWNAVVDALRANAKTMVDMRADMMGKTEAMTLPDRLAAREQAFTARLDGLKKLKAAIDPLYAALGDDQKKTADQIVTGLGMGCGGGGADMGCGAPGMGMGSAMMR